MSRKAKAAGFTLGIFIFLFIGALLGGWVLMLLLGALAHIFKAPNLAIGFWPSVGIDVLLNLVLGGIFGYNRA